MDKVVERQHDPFEIVLAFLFGLAGFSQLVTLPDPSSSAALLPTPFRILMAVLVLAGCVGILIGQFSPKVWGYLVEQVGLVAVGGAMITWGIAVSVLQLQYGALTSSSVIGGPLLVGLGVSFLWKRQQVMKRLKALR